MRYSQAENGGRTLIQLLLTNFCTIPPAAVKVSSAWYSAFDNFKDDKGNDLTFVHDMRLTLLHFKKHVDPFLHNNIELPLHALEVLSTLQF